MSKAINALARLLPRRIYEKLRWDRRLSGCRGFRYRDLEEAYAQICRNIDIAKIDRLREQVRPIFENDVHCAAKYSQHDYWLRTAVVQAAQLGLNQENKLRILDIGCGPGYFLTACRHFGHEAIGLDVPQSLYTPTERMVYGEVFSAHGSKKSEQLIQARVPIAVDGKFDLVTAFMICFNNHKQNNEWSVDEWKFFLSDIFSHMNPGGRLHLSLNLNPQRYPDLIWYDKEILALFKSMGQVVDETILIDKPT